MRDRIWHNLQNSKFKSEYLNRVSRASNFWGNMYSFFLAFASASSVAAWTIWNSVPAVWGGIVAFSQLLHIAKPYFPFFRSDREFWEMSHLYETLYLSYEKLWFAYERGQINENEAEKRFYKLRDNELAINKRFKHVYCPTFDRLIKKSSEEVALQLNQTFR
ncbi:hypothetical protein [Neptunomonas sp. XY-337]|uniref:hypothetical protein n=1 Tax=Neptunomonas sp. XY-337 TaxID=2561897 RepID=UPI0010A9C532|nr:hypothetical protein [Neptunomonas sp. XY-337]